MRLFDKLTRPLREANAKIDQIIAEEIEGVRQGSQDSAPHRGEFTMSDPQNKAQRQESQKKTEDTINDLNK